MLVEFKDVPYGWTVFQEDKVVASGPGPPLRADLKIGLYRIESGPEAVELEILDEVTLRYRPLPTVIKSTRGGKPFWMVSSPPEEGE